MVSILCLMWKVIYIKNKYYTEISLLVLVRIFPGLYLTIRIKSDRALSLITELARPGLFLKFEIRTLFLIWTRRSSISFMYTKFHCHQVEEFSEFWMGYLRNKVDLLPRTVALTKRYRRISNCEKPFCVPCRPAHCPGPGRPSLDFPWHGGGQGWERPSSRQSPTSHHLQWIHFTNEYRWLDDSWWLYHFFS